jgi:hypothetical protein
MEAPTRLLLASALVISVFSSCILRERPEREIEAVLTLRRARPLPAGTVKALAAAIGKQVQTPVTNTTLDMLILWGNNIEAGGAKLLADALASSEHENFSLDLSCNALGIACRDVFPEHVRVKFLEQPLSSGKPILSPVTSTKEPATAPAKVVEASA